MGTSEDMRSRVVEAIGEEGLAKLAALGLTICDPKDLDAFEKGLEDSNERARELTRASMRAADLRSMLVEVSVVAGENGRGLRIIVCDPAGDEEATIRKVAAAMHWASDTAEKTPKKPRRVGAKGGE